MNKANILIVDDDLLLMQGLRSMLECEKFVKAVFEACDADGFNRVIREQEIDIILLDVRLGKGVTGLELIRNLKNLGKNPYVIAVTALEGIEVIVGLLKLGIHGLVYKVQGYDAVINAITTVWHSGRFFPEAILRIIADNCNHWDKVPSVLFTFKEKEFLKALVKGMKTEKIAAMLNLAPGSAENLRIRLIKKAGVSNTAELISYAFRNGVL